MLFEEEGHAACVLVGLAERPFSVGVDHVGDPDECAFIVVVGEVSVEHVVGDVDGAIRKPAGEGRVGVIEYGFGGSEPVYLFCLFLPVLFA